MSESFMIGRDCNYPRNWSAVLRMADHVLTTPRSVTVSLAGTDDEGYYWPMVRFTRRWLTPSRLVSVAVFRRSEQDPSTLPLGVVRFLDWDGEAIREKCMRGVDVRLSFPPRYQSLSHGDLRSLEERINQLEAEIRPSASWNDETMPGGQGERNQLAHQEFSSSLLELTLHRNWHTLKLDWQESDTVLTPLTTAALSLLQFSSEQETGIHDLARYRMHDNYEIPVHLYLAVCIQQFCQVIPQGVRI